MNVPTIQPVQTDLKLARLLVSRMERLSADSPWAHQASGARGALLKLLEELEGEQARGIPASEKKMQRLRSLMKFSFNILEGAARELTE